MRRARRAGRVDPRLVLVMKPGGDAGLLERILERYAGSQEAVEVMICEVVVLPSNHRLAGRASVRMSDLAGETLPRWTDDCPASGPVVRDTGQVTQLIALGRTIAVLPSR